MAVQIDYKKRKARKEHKCYWCGSTIHKGEEHFWFKGLDKDYNEFYELRYHTDCSEVFDLIIDEYDYPDGVHDDEFVMEVDDYICENFRNEDDDIPIELLEMTTQEQVQYILKRQRDENSRTN